MQFYRKNTMINEKGGLILHIVQCLFSYQHSLFFSQVLGTFFCILLSSLLSKCRAFSSDVSALVKALCVVLYILPLKNMIAFLPQLYFPLLNKIYDLKHLKTGDSLQLILKIYCKEILTTYFW